MGPKTGTDIHMVMDVLDTLEHRTRFDEFIVLSGDADFTPVLLRLRDEMGAALVVIEHDMVYVRQIAAGRKVTVLHQGSVLCEGSVDEVQNDERVLDVYLGRKKRNN